MPYVTCTFRVTADIAAEPQVIVDLTRRLFVPEASSYAEMTTSGDLPGVYTQIASASDFPAVNIFALSTDQMCHLQFASAPLAAWQSAHTYGLGNQIADSNGNVQQALTAGVSDGTPPIWGTTLGATSSDAGVTWTCVALGSANGNIPLNSGGFIAIVDCNINTGAGENALIRVGGGTSANITGLAGGT